MSHPRSWWAALTLALALGACAAPETEPVDPAQLGLHEVSDVLPSSPAGERFGWVMGVINGDHEVDLERAAYVFSPIALDTRSAEDLNRLFGLIRAKGPWTLIGFAEAPEPDRLAAVIHGTVGYRLLEVRVQSAGEHRIDAVQIAPYHAP